MTFKAGQSGNLAGRPPKSRVETTRAGLYKHVPAITAAVIQKAVDGDIQAARLILDRVIPPLKADARTVQIIEVDDPIEQAGIIMSAALSGKISPDSADSLINTLLTKAKLLTDAELAERVEKIQKSLDEIRGMKK